MEMINRSAIERAEYETLRNYYAFRYPKVKGFTMTEIRPAIKTVEYETLRAVINYKERVMVLENILTGESITIQSVQFGELQAIMADIGRQTK